MADSIGVFRAMNGLRGQAPALKGCTFIQYSCCVQTSLFAADIEAPFPPGMRFVPEFLDEAQEARLLALIEGLDLAEARYKQYTARRRVAGFGGRFDYSTQRLEPAPEIPPAFWPLRERIAAWLSVDPLCFQHMMVAEYRPGTPLGWHRDVPEFESIVGISLQGHARMRLRPYPPSPGRSAETRQLDLPPRSAYVLEGETRWGWQHCIDATRELRYSITLRTMRGTALLLQRRAVNRAQVLRSHPGDHAPAPHRPR